MAGIGSWNFYWHSEKIGSIKNCQGSKTVKNKNYQSRKISNGRDG